jgi:hypothetical protein
MSHDLRLVREPHALGETEVLEAVVPGHPLLVHRDTPHDKDHVDLFVATVGV